MISKISQNNQMPKLLVCFDRDTEAAPALCCRITESVYSSIFVRNWYDCQIIVKTRYVMCNKPWEPSEGVSKINRLAASFTAQQIVSNVNHRCGIMALQGKF